MRECAFSAPVTANLAVCHGSDWKTRRNPLLSAFDMSSSDRFAAKRDS
ncbi:hypothetical protein Arad_0706 [Rhizobium rhizogenes K84]|uniref:Uncharacterized protein n=1 Tax=Rhizobium rhizogenes (strain K84 / ATCC BAA-868) TaxID=311403 RepID=B9J8E8_RHIR8|nr:hypothetical protein Arad_0706 [Rhizobium rhizogenes K84]